MPPATLVPAVERSAVPGTVATALDRLVDAHPGLGERLAADESLLDALVAVLAASRSLTDLCVRDAAAIEQLADLDRRASLDASAGRDELRSWKERELLRIAARDLVGRDDLTVVGAALSAMARDVLVAATRLAGAEGRLAVIAMGKLGGDELNYASDVDVMFVGRTATPDDEAAARKVMEVAGACFRVDADLRPEGRNGPLVRTPESYTAYWDAWAQTWEFQALLKARPAAGDARLGEQWLAAAEERVWQRPFRLDDLRAVRAMKARAEGEVARRQLSEREVKRGRGGIRDIEFAVQLLQLVHGREDDTIRSPTTLVALGELGRAGYIDQSDADAFADAYRFLRDVEHRLQLVDEQQVHAVPADDVARTRLARVMGYRDTPAGPALRHFDDALRHHQSAARAIHERLFFRPVLDALVGRDTRLPTAAIETRLTAFGFADAERTRVAVRELTQGLSRGSRVMQQLLPLVFEWLSESPDPDLGLLGLRRMAAGYRQANALAGAFRESPEVARRLCLLLGTSRLLAETVEHQPDLIQRLAEPDGLEPLGRDGLIAAAASSLAWRSGRRERQQTLLRLTRREDFRIAARDVLGPDETVDRTASALTDLAEATVESAVVTIAPAVPFAVIAMGRFGGAELSYASDLDVLFVYDGSTADDFAVAEAAATDLLAFLGGDGGPQRIFTVDLGLRPEGKQGPLARSLDGYRAYYQGYAQTWERQSLLRARPIAGDPDVGRRFMAIVDDFVWSRPFTDDDARNVRRMKARIERERIPPGDDPQFHLKLGRGSLSDIEFTAQLLQLQHHVPAVGTMAALDALAGAGALGAEDRDVLAAAYRFCERTRNRWFLVKGAPGDALPSQPDQLARLARSLETTPTELREHYRRVTRRARDVVERVFYRNPDARH
ncbi:MAG: (Glutamate--ammonia-ligase) adenylyltransferase [Acidimicrobiales bacterium]|jgi:glutamate-ammonia-ligase adenylyltransferase|nr:(Glutamate--ammonia-ligase) adenylyltransferase [Acidimicrobiales bacterium]